MRELYELARKGVARATSINLLEVAPTQWPTIVRRLAQFKLAEAASSPAMSYIVDREVQRRGGRQLSKDEMRNLIAASARTPFGYNCDSFVVMKRSSISGVAR
jgi:hypothetical protein